MRTLFREMPRCAGLPDGPCPDRRNDGTVRLGEGELMLCRKCDTTRHQAWLESNGRTASGSKSQPQSNAKIKETASNEAPVLQGQPQPKSRHIVLTDKFIVNELLAYVSFYRDKANHDALRSTLLASYLPSDITAAKKVFISRFGEQLGSSTLTAERRTSAAREAHEAEIEDIIAMYDS